MYNKESALEQLATRVAAEIMIAERRGLRPEEITECVIGEMTIRPGYPESFAPVTGTRFRVAFWDEFQHDADQKYGDGLTAGEPFKSFEDAKKYCEQSWQECADNSESPQSPLFWQPEGMEARATYQWFQGSVRKTMHVKYLIVRDK